MRILFIGYWSLHEPLTISTIFPHLRLLQERDDVEHITLTTVERGVETQADLTLRLPFPNTKISFRPLLSREHKILLLNKVDDFVRFPRELAALAKAEGSTVLLARGAPAGALAYLAARRCGLPFYVESFEPHAEYMRNGGVWKPYDPRYLVQVYMEQQQKKNALGLMPVAEAHRRLLIAEGVPARQLVTVPCSVNMATFGFDAARRVRQRQALEYGNDAVVGIYVGKFGGIYYEDEAFDIFAQAAAHFGAAFRLIVLTAHPAAGVEARLAAAGLNPAHCLVKRAPHAEVPDYLAAADFAFLLSRPTPGLSPIKVGEYWASGLPILLAEGVGDDSGIVEREGGGATFDLTQPESVKAALVRIEGLLQQTNHRADATALAVRHRSPERAREAYQQFFG
ncbi:glycosyltransferase [Hymenobacter armeniacus]|uniref:Glycosyltransferase subfamily 4-like N-terminal domain-containing protein n=1 Tax=Hymenobacter armeniacus TaxID=2771358 RepID=A0ABR8JSM3_9BACT|nr:glycosyltransferase [Hymenobacter armeniacus]MBD2721801.1 hypothetical protein [Hymenobacter armeniacus]